MDDNSFDINDICFDCENIAVDEIQQTITLDEIEEKVRKERERVKEVKRKVGPLSTLAVPSEYNICRFCKYWQAKPDVGRKMGSPINGICTEYSFKSPATAEKCDRFVPDYGKIFRSSVDDILSPYK